jgi:hypothetical protein
VCTDTILNLIAPHEETCGAAPLSIFFHLSNMQQLASTRPNETTSKFDQRDIFSRQPELENHGQATQITCKNYRPASTNINSMLRRHMFSSTSLLHYTGTRIYI